MQHLLPGRAPSISVSKSKVNGTEAKVGGKTEWAVWQWLRMIQKVHVAGAGRGSSYPDLRLELFETLLPSLEVEMSSSKCAQAQVRRTRWVIKSFLRAK